MRKEFLNETQIEIQDCLVKKIQKRVGKRAGQTFNGAGAGKGPAMPAVRQRQYPGRAHLFKRKIYPNEI